MNYNYNKYIKAVDDFPEKGVKFFDLAPLIGSGAVFQALIEEMAGLVPETTEKIVAFDARGFIFGGAVAAYIGAGLVLLRKPGKLAGELLSVYYDLEYGSNQLELQQAALRPGEHVTLIDDVVATGGTALAGVGLVKDAEAEVDLFLGVLDLPHLGGSDKIKESDVPFTAIIESKV